MYPNDRRDCPNRRDRGRDLAQSKPTLDAKACAPCGRLHINGDQDQAEHAQAENVSQRHSEASCQQCHAQTDCHRQTRRSKTDQYRVNEATGQRCVPKHGCHSQDGA